MASGLKPDSHEGILDGNDLCLLAVNYSAPALSIRNGKE